MIHRGPDIRLYFCLAHSQNSDKQTIFSPQSISVIHFSIMIFKNYSYLLMIIYYSYLNQLILLVNYNHQYNHLQIENLHQYLC